MVQLLRRAIVLGGPSLLLLGVAKAASLPTPAQTQGPFYPRRLPADSDLDLTVYGAGRPEGRVIDVIGRVTDVRAKALADTVVEIWQADALGVYSHVGAPGGDPNFQGYGAVRTGPDGAYRFRTIVPGLYPGRTRHIHVKVRPPAGDALTTQMYFPGEPQNDRDGLYRRLGSDAARAAVTAMPEPGEPPRLRFDIVLG